VIAQSHWNVAAGATRSTALVLLDSTGTSTGASVTWSAAGGWMTPIADQPGNARLMKGYLDTTSTSTTVVSVTGLPLRVYDVYVYADGDNKSYARSGTYAISGAGITPASVSLLDAAGVNFVSTFTRANGNAGNYVQFTVTGSAFTITAAPLAPSTGTRRAPINAIQIVPATPSAGSVAIDFTGSAPADMGTSESAGVVPQSHWNAARGAASGVPLALVDATGAITSATAAWSASNTWLTPITDTAGNARMMKGYLDTTNTSTSSVTIAGLASGTYDVYVYVDGDNGSFTRTGAYSVNAGGASTVVNVTDQGSTNFGGAFTAARNSAGNYVQFVLTGTGFTLTARPVSGSNTTLRAPINGIQVLHRVP
jgi:hypothetical protein